MSRRPDIPAILERHEEALEGEMKALLADRQGPLYEMMRYHLGSSRSGGARGKHLRPVLTLLSCELVGGDWRSALPAAPALGPLPHFSLIHASYGSASSASSATWAITFTVSTGYCPTDVSPESMIASVPS